MTDAAAPAPSPLRDDDLRNQHRATAAFILGRYDRGGIITRGEVAELRRMTAAEQAECDGARQLADEWQANALHNADRLDEQERRTRKARQQRDEARRQFDAERDRANARAADAERYRRQLAGALGLDANAPWADVRLRAEQARADAERYQADHLSACRTIAEMHAAATGRTGEGPVRGVVEDVADVRTRAMLAEQHAAQLQQQLDAAHRRHDAADALRYSAPLTYTAAEVDARVDAARLNARAEIAAANQAREQAEHDRDRRRRQVANRLGVPEDTSWPDLLGAIGVLRHGRQQAAQRATFAEQKAAKFEERWNHWKAAAREVDTDRERIAAELEQAKATHNARRVELARALGQRMDLHWESLFGLARSLRHGNADLKARAEQAEAAITAERDAHEAHRVAILRALGKREGPGIVPQAWDLLIEHTAEANRWAMDGACGRTPAAVRAKKRAEKAEQRAAQLEAAARRAIDLCGDQGSDVQNTLRAALGGDAEPEADGRCVHLRDGGCCTGLGYCAHMCRG